MEEELAEALAKLSSQLDQIIDRLEVIEGDVGKLASSVDAAPPSPAA